MGYLSRGVQVPPSHLEDGRILAVRGKAETALVELDISELYLRVLVSEQPPEDAFVAVRYQGHWFYVEHSDHSSKQSFALLIYLFQLQSPKAPSAAPVLTVPTG